MMMHYPFRLTEPQPHLPNAIAVATALAGWSGRVRAGGRPISAHLADQRLVP